MECSLLPAQVNFHDEDSGLQKGLMGRLADRYSLQPLHLQNQLCDKASLLCEFDEIEQRWEPTNIRYIMNHENAPLSENFGSRNFYNLAFNGSISQMEINEESDPNSFKVHVVDEEPNHKDKEVSITSTRQATKVSLRQNARVREVEETEIASKVRITGKTKSFIV